MRNRIAAGLTVAALLAVPALAQGPRGPRGQCGMGRGGGNVEGAEALTEGGLEALGLALQDEYRAEGLYKQVIERLGDVRPFAHIVYAEQRHSAALERHLPAFERCAAGTAAHGPRGKMAGGCCDRCERRGWGRAGR